MSRPRSGGSAALGEALYSLLTVFLLSAGASLCLCAGLFDRRGAALPVILLCAGTALAAALYGAFIRARCRFAVRAVLWAAAAAGVTAWGFMGGGPAHDVMQVIRALIVTVAGDGGVMAMYASRARVLVCVCVTLLMHFAAADGDFAPAAILFLLMTAPVCASFDGDLAARLAPGVAGLLLLLAARGGRRAAAAVVACLTAAAGFFLLPPAGMTAEPFADAAEDIRAFVEDYLMYDDVRTSFSLERDGYLPLSSRLGGAASPSDRSVMEVTTDRAVRLRAAAYDMYSGTMWYDTLSSRRYLYVSPAFSALRDALFDLSLPLAYAGAPGEATVKIHMLSDATTTLYAPQRARGITAAGDRMVLYYNTASELFLTRDLAVGDEYSARYLPLAAGDAATEALVSACADADDPHYAEVAAQYLTVPDYMQDAVYAIAAAAAGGGGTPYQTARSIERYLSAHYRYDLDVASPPENVDFLTWFLLGEEKAGYCTYFATAMTMMCRMAGLPARYVTGYLVPSEESGATLVTGENAHAWTEVYLNGFGWLAFDATPDDGDGENESASPPPAAPSPSPSAQPSPSPEPSPSPSPSPDPSDDPSGASDPTPTPTPSPAPDGASDPTPPPDGDAADAPDAPDIHLWWLLLPLLAALLYLRWYLTEPTRRAARRPADAALIYYAAVRDTLAVRRLRRLPDETLLEFAARAESMGMPAPFTPLAAAASSMVYGRSARFTAQQAAAFKALYVACRGALRPFARARAALARMASFDPPAFRRAARRQKRR